MLLRTLAPAVFAIGAVICVAGVYLVDSVRGPAPPIPPAVDKSAADKSKSLKI